MARFGKFQKILHVVNGNYKASPKRNLPWLAGSFVDIGGVSTSPENATHKFAARFGKISLIWILFIGGALGCKIS